MSLFLSRSSKPSHMLEWKVRVFTGGAAMARMGSFMEQRWLTGAAIAVLVAGALLRFPFSSDAAEGGEPGSTEEEGDAED